MGGGRKVIHCILSSLYLSKREMSENLAIPVQGEEERKLFFCICYSDLKPKCQLSAVCMMEEDAEETFVDTHFWSTR